MFLMLLPRNTAVCYMWVHNSVRMHHYSASDFVSSVKITLWYVPLHRLLGIFRGWSVYKTSDYRRMYTKYCKPQVKMLIF
jgi:hypothetical protein